MKLELPKRAKKEAINALGFGRRALRPEDDLDSKDYITVIRKLNTSNGSIEISEDELTVFWDAAVRYQEDCRGRGNTSADFERLTLELTKLE